MRRLIIITATLLFLASCSSIRQGEAVSPDATAPLFTFVFDDGNDTDYIVAREIFAEQGVVACSAVTTDWIDKPDHLSVDQIRGLRDAGWEIMSHTASHPRLTSLTPAQLEDEFARSRKALENLGITVRNIVYPYNMNNELVRQIARNYYRSGRGGTNTVNNAATDPYFLRSYSNKHDLARMKEHIDRAYEERSWIVFYHHQVDMKVDLSERQGAFIPGETLLFKPSGAIGRYEPPTWYLFFGSLYFVPLSGTPRPGDTIVGENSGATARLDHFQYDERAQIRELIRYVKTKYPDMRIVTIDQGLDILGFPKQRTKTEQRTADRM
jgi:peptidoglycan/xylan/chitin deacetylase (PgdA/CDA1 family)